MNNDRILAIIIVLLLLISTISIAIAAEDGDDDANVILDRELEVGSGVAIEHSIKIEVVEVKTDIIDCAKLRLSSYQKPARVISLFTGDSPSEYKTSSGASIYIEVISVYGDSVSLKVTGPEDWRVTNYYTVESEDEDEETKKEAVTVPKLDITRTFDTTVSEPGQVIAVTIKIRNTGNGTATDVMLDESPIRGTYKEDCPTTIEDIAAGETKRVSYTLKIVDVEPGTYELSPSILNYQSESDVSFSSESKTSVLEITAAEVLLPDIEVSIGPVDSIMACGDDFTMTVTIRNVGNATSGIVTIKSNLPPDVQVVSGEDDPVYESIEPGESEEYGVTLRTHGEGKHIIDVQAMWEDGEAVDTIEFWAEKSGMEQYYIYILAAIPILLLLLWAMKRRKDYSY